MTNYDDYPYVAAWHRLMGSYDYYIRDRVEQARQEHAPPNAVHRREDGTWITTDDITSAATRQRLGLDPLPPREPELLVILTDLRRAILIAERFRDLFGLTDVEQLDEQTLRIRFSTGWSARLTLQLRSSELPE